MTLRQVTLQSEIDFADWRNAARALLAEDVTPDRIVWIVRDGAGDLFGASAEARQSGRGVLTVPRHFVELAETAILHSAPERFGLLYRLLYRLRENPQLLSVAVDGDVARAEALAKSVRRDKHKMTAFVRFREVKADDGPRFIAWFEPSHYIVEATAPFFVRRFASMRWTILSPRVSAHWDGEALAFGPGASRSDAPADDAMEDIWRRYYAHIFNPARLKVSAMRAEMPEKYWRNLPEALLIKPLIEASQRRTNEMVTRGGTTRNPHPQKLAPQEAVRAAEAGTLAALYEEAASCRACPLWKPATQTVFGEGPPSARLMFVGEQPGDKEDLAGKPFVGPAGQLFDRALAQAGIERDKTYVTNAVKHFKFMPRGKIRLHQKPNGGEIAACRFWLTREIDLIEPELIVAMGATAAQSLFGRATPIGKNRGRIIPLDDGRQALVTVHPSYLLRLPDKSQADAEFDRFVADLALAAESLRKAA